MAPSMALRRDIPDTSAFDGAIHTSRGLPLGREWDELGHADEVMHHVFHDNAERVLGR